MLIKGLYENSDYCMMIIFRLLQGLGMPQINNITIINDNHNHGVMMVVLTWGYPRKHSDLFLSQRKSTSDPHIPISYKEIWIPVGGWEIFCSLGDRSCSQNMKHHIAPSNHYITNTPPKFNSSPLKNGGWKTTFLLGR